MEIKREESESKCKYVVWNDYGSRVIGSATLINSTDPIKLKQINIKRNSRSKGVGSALLKNILEDFKDSEIIAKTFKPRLNWYQRHGFEIEEDKGRLAIVRRKPA